MAKITVNRSCSFSLLLSLLLIINNVSAANNTINKDDIPEPSLAQVADILKDHRLDGVEVLENNQLPLLDNRFRIDHKVKEITLLFFRKSGSPPVILVKPDGSKMYASLAVTGEADWFAEKTYDLIRIINPMPGPWQAVGKMTKGSKVMIITDFELHVDDLPEIMIQGESIKVTAHVTNSGEPILAADFRDVIALDVEFYSTNNKKYANFGAGLEVVTHFLDDGKGFDERPRDGIFTGEFLLRFAPGEWVPKYRIRTPLMTRELDQKPIIIYPIPVKLSVATTNVADEFHQLKIEVIGDYVKKESLIFEGKVQYPNQEVQSFSIIEKTTEARIFNVINYDFGLYRISISAFGEDNNGRQFMIDIPEFTFNIDPPPVEEASPEEQAIIDARYQSEMAAQQPLAPEPEPEDDTNTIIIIVAVNLVLAIIGWLAIRVFVHGKSLKVKLPNMKLPKISFKRKAKIDDDDGEEGPKNKERDKNQTKEDDILDLSLPDN